MDERASILRFIYPAKTTELKLPADLTQKVSWKKFFKDIKPLVKENANISLILKGIVCEKEGKQKKNNLLKLVNSIKKNLVCLTIASFKPDSGVTEAIFRSLKKAPRLGELNIEKITFTPKAIHLLKKIIIKNSFNALSLDQTVFRERSRQALFRIFNIKIPSRLGFHEIELPVDVLNPILFRGENLSSLSLSGQYINDVFLSQLGVALEQRASPRFSLHLANSLITHQGLNVLLAIQNLEVSLKNNWIEFDQYDVRSLEIPLNERNLTTTQIRLIQHWNLSHVAEDSGTTLVIMFNRCSFNDMGALRSLVRSAPKHVTIHFSGQNEQHEALLEETHNAKCQLYFTNTKKIFTVDDLINLVEKKPSSKNKLSEKPDEKSAHLVLRQIHQGQPENINDSNHNANDSENIWLTINNVTKRAALFEYTATTHNLTIANLIEYLEKGLNLSSLHLMDYQISPDELKTLLDNLRQQKNFVGIVFERCQLNEQHCIALADLIYFKHPQLKKMILVNNHIGDKGARILLDALKTNSLLENFIFEGNHPEANPISSATHLLLLQLTMRNQLLAAIHGDHYSQINKLLSEILRLGIKLDDLKDGNDLTPFALAASLGKPKICKMLLPQSNPAITYPIISSHPNEEIRRLMPPSNEDWPRSPLERAREKSTSPVKFRSPRRSGSNLSKLEETWHETLRKKTKIEKEINDVPEKIKDILLNVKESEEETEDISSLMENEEIDKLLFESNVLFLEQRKNQKEIESLSRKLNRVSIQLDKLQFDSDNRSRSPSLQNYPNVAAEAALSTYEIKDNESLQEFFDILRNSLKTLMQAIALINTPFVAAKPGRTANRISRISGVASALISAVNLPASNIAGDLLKGGSDLIAKQIDKRRIKNLCEAINALAPDGDYIEVSNEIAYYIAKKIADKCIDRKTSTRNFAELLAKDIIDGIYADHLAWKKLQKQEKKQEKTFRSADEIKTIIYKHTENLLKATRYQKWTIKDNSIKPLTASISSNTSEESSEGEDPTKVADMITQASSREANAKPTTAGRSQSPPKSTQPDYPFFSDRKKTTPADEKTKAGTSLSSRKRTET